MFAGCFNNIIAFVQVCSKEAPRQVIRITQQAAGKVVDSDGLQVFGGGNDQLSLPDGVDADCFCLNLFVADGSSCIQEVTATVIGWNREDITVVQGRSKTE